MSNSLFHKNVEMSWNILNYLMNVTYWCDDLELTSLLYYSCCFYSFIMIIICETGLFTLTLFVFLRAKAMISYANTYQRLKTSIYQITYCIHT